MRKLFLALLMCTIIAGCSGGGSVLSPGVDYSSNSKPGFSSIDATPIIEGLVYPDGTFQGTGLMGAYDLQINPDNFSADLVSKRMPTLGESWTISGSGFFTIAPCSSCLSIKSMALTPENHLQIAFHIKHPFPKGNTAQPPSASNRLDLDLFDVALVVHPIGATPVNYSLTGSKAYTGFLANNAGYTTELSKVINDNAALPYALVIDDDAAAKNTFNKFAMGADSFFDVFFDTNLMTSLNFDLYLTMGYGASAQGKTQRLTPTYFNPEFNRKQAWKVVAIPPNGTNPPDRFNTWNDKLNNVPWNVTVKVWDWQQGVTSVVKPPVAAGDIAYASDVATVAVEIPGMNNAPQTAAAPPTGTGSPGDPLVYTIPIMNQNLLEAGEYMGLVKVADERVPTTTPPGADGIDFMIDTPDGITLTNYGIPEFATYQTFIATVVIGNQDPTASAVATTPTTVYDGQTVSFNASASTDPDGTIVTYEWDFNEDGIFAGSGDEYTGPAATPTHVFRLGDGSIAVQLRVTDNMGAQDTLDSPIAITVNPSKNLTLRTGVSIWDIATDETDGSVFIYYSDQQIWKYNSLLGNGALWVYCPWGTGTGATDGRIEVAPGPYVMCVTFPVPGSGWFATCFDPSTGYPGYWGGWGTMGGVERCEAWASRNPNNSQPLGFSTWYPYVTSWTLSCFFPGTTYNSLWLYVGSSCQNGAGCWYKDYVMGAHGIYNDTVSPEILYVEGDPEYQVERSTATGGGYPSDTWGAKSDGNNGFNNPQDITTDRYDNVYILDILSTSERKIKAFTLTGTSLGSFGDNTTIGAVPIHMDSSWSTNDYLYVTTANTVSIFFPPEHPF